MTPPWPDYVAEHAPLVRWEVARRLGRRYDLVDDLTQDALVRALRYPPVRRGPENLGWLRAHVVCAISDYWRGVSGRRGGERREAPVSLNEKMRELERPGERSRPRDRCLTQPPFDEALEARDELVRRLQVVKPRDRRALWMVGAGFSSNEIAQDQGSVRKTVDARLCRARQAIALVEAA
jgi:RNA polymerase sigma factor (sigma-70 family)